MKQELNATSKVVQDKLHAIGYKPQKKVVTHRFEPTSKYVLLFIVGMALSLVISIWGNLTQWREHQDWEEADLKYRALKMVLPSDDPNVRYIEKNFSVCPNKEVIEKVRTRVNIYEDSIRYHNEMIQMAAIKDSIANSLFKEVNEIKRKLIRNNRQRPTGTSAFFASTRLRLTVFASYSTAQGLVRASTMFQHTNFHSTLNYSSVSVMPLV